jgi:F-type H+-transporting ATPase subunit delta
MSSSDFDTGKQHLANVYAKALLGAAQASGSTDAVLAEFDQFVGVLDRAPDLEPVLTSYRIDAAEKEALLDKVLSGKISATLLNFLKVMARHGRLDCLRATHQAAQRLYNDMRGRREVYVKTAEPIDHETRELIAARLRSSLKADVDLHVEVDPAMIGGLVVRVGDTVYDGSVANRLARFREEALASATQEMRARLDRFLAPA